MNKNEGAAKIVTVHKILTKFYGRLKLEPRREPFRELISTMLSHRTNHANEEKAYFQMLDAFGGWEGVLNAPFDELAATLAPAQFPGQKAANIQKTLKIIKGHPANGGKISIDFLKKMDTQEALDWLTSLPGVGLKTASLLLLFNYKKPVMPVDTHVFRVSQRVGILGATDTPEKAHKILLELLPPKPVELYNYHIHLLWHDQRICVWRKPKCEKCPLTGLCNYYQEVVKVDLKIRK